MGNQGIVIQRIEELLKYLGISISELGRRTGMSQSNLTQILKGNRPCGDGVVTKIASSLGINKDWLLGLSGDMKIPTAETRPHVPFEVFAGRMGGHAESIMLRDCEQRPLIPSAPPYDLTITVAGQSMSPVFESGDIVAVRRVTDPSVIRWGEVYVVSSLDGVAIKRVYRDPDGLRLVSYNPDYPDYTIQADPSVILYKVVALMRIF